MLRIARYGTSRFWALYDGQDLVVVTVYKRGATELLRRLAAQAPAAAAAAAQAAANGQAHGTPPPVPPSNGTAAHGAAQPPPDGWCAVHQVPMERRQNERGSWYSHWLPDAQRHCKGRR